ncbi:uncharacterized protein MONBRDRAFT_16139, partial [Monosiga brevicollis MX1]
TYTGMWRQARPHGEGSMHCIDGRKYDGQFHNGLCHGYATLQSGPAASPIAMATGNWSRGLLHGHATVQYHNNDKYSGEWLGGERHGFGIITFSDGSTYHGGWQHDQRHGYGVFRAVEERYVGMWQQEQRSGPGLTKILPSLSS